MIKTPRQERHDLNRRNMDRNPAAATEGGTTEKKKKHQLKRRSGTDRAA